MGSPEEGVLAPRSLDMPRTQDAPHGEGVDLKQELSRDAPPHPLIPRISAI